MLLTARKIIPCLVILSVISGACGISKPASSTDAVDPPLGENIPAGEQLFFDDFSDPNSGWRSEDTYYFRGYADGEYKIRIDQDEDSYIFLTAVSGQIIGDVQMEVDVDRVSGSTRAGIYLICRYQDNDNYYYAEIEGDGSLMVAAFFDGEQVVLIEDFPSGVIPGQNHYQLDCIGPEMTVYVDGTQILSAAPLKILEGDVGFGAGGSGSEITDVRFDNFGFRSP